MILIGAALGGARATPRARSSARSSGGESDPHRHAECRDRPHGRRAQLPPRPPPPRRRVAHRRGRQGRQRRAGAEAARAARSSPPGSRAAPTGARILERLAEESILNDFTRIEGESRTNLAVVDPTSGEQTEINERGPEVRAEEVDAFIEKLLYLAQGASLCVLAGSVPPGVDPALYARLIGELRRARACRRSSTPTASRCASGFAPSPRWSRRTSSEAEEAVGHEFNDADDLALGLAGPARDGRPRGGDHPRGRAASRSSTRAAATATRSRSSRSSPSRAVGSGDCFLAGYVAARYEGASPRECLAYGVACGAESTQHFGAGTLNPHEVDRLLPRVEVRELDVPAGVN